MEPTRSAFSFLSQGAIIQAFNVSGHNIVLGFPDDDPALYKTHNSAYFGETIGRTTNRVKGAQLRNLNGGKTYPLTANEGSNALHGGLQGWEKKDFIEVVRTSTPEPRRMSDDDRPEKKQVVEFRYTSPDGEEGYPGTVECRVWYTEKAVLGKTVLEVEYEVELVGDDDGCEETVVSVTNHSYFNLNPSATDITGTVVTLSTNLHLELGPDRIPTGRILPHPSLPDPSVPFTLGSTSPSFDDYIVLDDPSSASQSHCCPLDSRPLALRQLCTLVHPATKLHLEIWSTEPGFQFYTGEGIDVPELDTRAGLKIPARGARAGVAVEPSRYVDCSGREEWRGMCLLQRGEVWGARTVYQAWKG